MLLVAQSFGASVDPRDRGVDAPRFGEAVLSGFDRATGARPDLRELIRLPPASTAGSNFSLAPTPPNRCSMAPACCSRVGWPGFRCSTPSCAASAWRWTRAPSAHRRADARHHHARHRALAGPSRDHAHLLVLLRARLAQLQLPQLPQLPAPTLDLRLHADDIARRVEQRTLPYLAVRARRADAAGALARTPDRPDPWWRARRCN